MRLARAQSLSVFAAALLGGCFSSIDVSRIPNAAAACDGGACGLDTGEGGGTGDAGDYADAGDARDAGDAGPACPLGMVRVSAPTPFCMDATEVTNDAYRQFLSSRENKTEAPPCGWNTDKSPVFAWPPSPEQAMLPVRGVDWCDARAYCSWIGKRLCGRIGGGRPSRAQATDPLRSEWAFACSAGGAHTYPYGDTYVEGACVGGATGPETAGGTPSCEGGVPGLFDLSGNVDEWVDCEATNTGDGVGQGMNDTCLTLGGAYTSGPETLRCNSAMAVRRSEASPTRGFRCCE